MGIWTMAKFKLLRCALRCSLGVVPLQARWRNNRPTQFKVDLKVELKKQKTTTGSPLRLCGPF